MSEVTFKNVWNYEVVVERLSYFPPITKYKTIIEGCDNMSPRSKRFPALPEVNIWTLRTVYLLKHEFSCQSHLPAVTRLRLRRHLILAYRPRCHSRRFRSFRMLLCTQVRVSCSHISLCCILKSNCIEPFWVGCLAQGCPSSWVEQVCPLALPSPIQ